MPLASKKRRMNQDQPMEGTVILEPAPQNILLPQMETTGHISMTVETTTLVDSPPTSTHGRNTQGDQSKPLIRLTGQEFPSLQTKTVRDLHNEIPTKITVGGTIQDTHRITGTRPQQWPEIFVTENNKDLPTEYPYELDIKNLP